MTNFIFPSDADRAENEDLDRVCQHAEELIGERDAALEREAALAEKLGRYSMCAGHAEQRRAESRAVRKELGFGEDADDVSPRNLLDAIARRDLIKQAQGWKEAANDLELMECPKSAQHFRESAVRHLMFKASKLRKTND